MVVRSDFIAENGGTRVIPGSHLWDETRRPRLDEAAPTEMKSSADVLARGVRNEFLSEDDVDRLVRNQVGAAVEGVHGCVTMCSVFANIRRARVVRDPANTSSWPVSTPSRTGSRSCDRRVAEEAPDDHAPVAHDHLDHGFRDRD
jgi:hypothetical protein